MAQRTSIAPPCPRIVRGQERLTPEQEDYARRFAQEHIAAMLATTAIDEQEAEQHLRDAYRVAGLPPPARIRWFDSPIQFLRSGSSVWSSVWSSVGSSVGSSVWSSVGSSVWSSVGSSVWSSVWSSVTIAYFVQNELAFFRFFHEMFEENDLIHLALFNEMVSGYYLGSNEAWLVRKPVVLERDEQERLHSAAGKCVQYPDGWGFYAWHGVRVPERLILHPESITKKDWLREDNLEVRRVMQERMPDFVQAIGGRCIDRGHYADLYEVSVLPDPERVAHYVRVRDSSTEREYYLRVPPTIQDADEGVAWTFGLAKTDYHPSQQA